MFYKKQFITLVCILKFCLVQAQVCDLVLRGCLSDADNNEHLGFAYIKLINTNNIVQTNEHGEFMFDKLCKGSYQILVKHLGCRDTLFEVVLNSSKKINLQLPHSVNNLEEINIMDKRVEMKKTQSESNLSKEEIQKSKGQSLGEMLKNISGVSSLNTGATISKPMIHGMQGYRLLILNNGIRQEGQQWGNEHAPEIDPFIAKKISVVKGVNAIRYGSDAMAGVVLVEADELPDSAGMSGEMNLVGLSNGRNGASSAMLQGKLQKLNLSWRIQGTLKQGGSLKTPNYFLTNTGLEEKNFSYALAYHRSRWGVEMYYSQFTTTIGIYKGSHSGNLSDLETILQRGRTFDTLSNFSYSIGRPKQSVAHELVKTTIHYHLSSQWRSKLNYARQYNLRQEYDLRRLTSIERETGKVLPDLDLQITSQSIEGIVEHDNIKSFRGVYGASYMNQQNTYQGRFFIPNYLSNSGGIFATERYVMRHAELEMGVRYDEKRLQSFFYKGKIWSSSQRNFGNTTFNAGYIWKPDTSFNLFVNTGSAWRAPSANELYSNGIHQGIASIERGNDQLKTERCYNITVTSVFKRKKFNAEATLYYNQFNNYIYLNPAGTVGLTIRGSFPEFNYTQADVRISGSDLNLKYLFNKTFSATFKGMLVRGWNNKTSSFLIYMPSDRADLSFTIKLPSLARLQNSFIQMNGSFVNKQWRVPQGVDFAPPPTGYYIFGVELATEIKLKKQNLFVNLSATNVLNTVYREYLDRFRYYCDAPGVSYNLRLCVPFGISTKRINQNVS